MRENKHDIDPFYLKHPLDPFLKKAPAPREKLLAIVKVNIPYDKVAHDILYHRINGSLQLLDQLVDLILDVQYTPQKYEGTIRSREQYYVPAEYIAATILQARWYNIELVIDNTSAHIGPSEAYLLYTLYHSIGSREAYRFEENQRREEYDRMMRRAKRKLEKRKNVMKL